MNATGCAWPAATDDIFMYDFTQPGSCDARMEVWIGIAAADITVKVVMMLLLFKLWLRRVGSNNNMKGRLPIVPALGVMGLITHTLFWVLVGLNLASRGTAAVLIGFMWLDFVVPWIIYCLKFVRLGLKAASSRVKKWKLLKEDNRLAHMDPLGRFLFLGLLTCTSGTVLTQCILAPIFFDDPRPMFAGIAFNGMFFIAVSSFMGVQIQRLKRSINETVRDNLNTMSNEAKHDFSEVRNRLTLQLVIMVSFCVPFSVLFFLITARVIAFRYWIVAICWLASSSGMLLQTATNFIFSAARRRRRNTGSLKPPTRDSAVALASATLPSAQAPASRSSVVEQKS